MSKKSQFSHVYKKEMLEIFRDKRTFILVVFLPMLIFVGLILFYESLLTSSDNEVTVAVNKTADSALLNQLHEQNKEMTFEKVNNPKQSAAKGDANIAMIADEDALAKMEKGESVSFILYSDSSDKNSAAAVGMLNAQLEVINKAVTADQLAKANISTQVLDLMSVEVKPLSNGSTEIEASRMMLTILLPMLLCLGVTIGAYPVVSELFAGEKDKKIIDALLVTPVKRGTLLFGKWAVAMTVSLFTAIISLAATLLVIFFATTHLRKALDAMSSPITIFVVGMLAVISFAALIVSIQTIAAIFAKSMKEANSYQSPIMMLAIIPSFVPMFISISQTTTAMFFIPLANISFLLREMIYDQFVWSHLLATLASNLILASVFLILAKRIYSNNNYLLSK
ncbi:ABC transporter permease [Listeria welshimeri]|uniref:ABC transporter permease n=1 Tax=Listeria welshimeri TaxID=1643 RepID=UPI001628DCA2|nr:ABC transporter permease [Listeria welshimeri]MBC1477466.1 ABC transporter permease [Listeria welshimeri]MBC2009848.1 ABC transporter permease [Listeria welshimeri]MBF2351156.1 ABC transporter permease [Listeria welshimeri]MBF2356547.1 ABC transporter permease [Listeria welshimeri]MBF2424414.1 ABC transporter permease [Listeria welshimeri]